MKLRSMSATVDFVDSITLKLGDGENIHLENAYVLTSYAFASGIVTGVEPANCKCEGCDNWPCEGVCGLTEHVETY